MGELLDWCQESPANAEEMSIALLLPTYQTSILALGRGLASNDKTAPNKHDYLKCINLRT